VKCWGSNQRGQLGPAVAGELHAPGADTRLRGHAVDAIAAGNDHTCAILAGGALRCWGRNDSGQLGLGDAVNRGDQPAQLGDALPTVDVGGAAVTAVAAGAAHTCAVLDGGEVKCWGEGIYGQLGLGRLESHAAPTVAVALPAAAASVVAGAEFSCALLTDGRVTCWGAGERGALGLGDRLGRVEPDGTVKLGATAIAIAAGDHHACALLASHALACWGANDRGQLGLGDTQDRSQPATVALTGSAGVIAVGARLDSTCVLRDGGQVTCWGANDRGQLGLGDAEDRAAPAASVALGTARRASALSVGGAFACALLDTAQAKCWGDNVTSQLGAALRGPAYGDGPSETGDFLPVAFQGGGRSVRAIASGRAHTCAILDTGDVRCWGDNGEGQLGAGDANAHALLLDPTGVVDLGAAP
jgi:alpha-tubulin suppressor-like RCC1 family protein